MGRGWNFERRKTRHPAATEGLNRKIMLIKRRAGGFSNPENFKTAIDIHYGGFSHYL